jgi:hypothetical protein
MIGGLFISSSPFAGFLRSCLIVNFMVLKRAAETMTGEILGQILGQSTRFYAN